MKVRKPFPHEQSKWFNAEKRREWNERLERTGFESVRMRLAAEPGSSQGELWIGGDAMDRGFVEEWVSWHAEQRDEAQEELQSKMTSAAQGAMWAAIFSAVAAVVAAGGTIVQAYHAAKEPPQQTRSN